MLNIFFKYFSSILEKNLLLILNNPFLVKYHVLKLMHLSINNLNLIVFYHQKKVFFFYSNFKSLSKISLGGFFFSTNIILFSQFPLDLIQNNYLYL